MKWNRIYGPFCVWCFGNTSVESERVIPGDKTFNPLFVDILDKENVCKLVLK